MPRKETHWFPFGKYKGHGVSQTALTVLESVTGKGGWGYGYVHWAHHNLKKVGQGLREDLGRHVKVLNEFQSVVPCQACGNNDPRVISLAFGYGNYFANGPYVYCDTDSCRGSIEYSKIIVVPLGFKALLSVSSFDKGLQRISHETLRYLAGWPQEQRVTNEAAAAFVDTLEEKNQKVAQARLALAKPRRGLEEELNDLDPANWEEIWDEDGIDVPKDDAEEEF